MTAVANRLMQTNKVIGTVSSHQEMNRGRKTHEERESRTRLEQMFYRISERVVPHGIHGEIAHALKLNYEHDGLIRERLEAGDRITYDDIYASVVAYLRHEFTGYDYATKKGDMYRKSYNNHDQAQAIMGSRSKW